MLHTLTSQIEIAWRGEVCDTNFLRLIEGIYAIGTVNATGCDFNSAFILRTGRKPTAVDADLFERLKTSTIAPFKIYQSNYNLYCAQLLHLRHGILLPSSQEIRQAYKDVCGYLPTDDNLHMIGRLVRLHKFDLVTGYYTANLWQLMEVAACLDYMGITRKDSTISTVFNKIYKRTPSEAEVSAIKIINFTKTAKETRNEIESFIKISETDSGREPPDRAGYFCWRKIRRQGPESKPG